MLGEEETCYDLETDPGLQTGATSVRNLANPRDVFHGPSSHQQQIRCYLGLKRNAFAVCAAAGTDILAWLLAWLQEVSLLFFPPHRKAPTAHF